MVDIAPHAVRREPSQRRSRERMEKILAVASDLIAAKGSDTMRMSEVAELAGISIGSLYQYFPDKAAIIRTLFQRYNAAGRACIEEGLANVRSMADLGQAFGALIDIYYGLFLAEPVMRDIWSGTQADRALQEVELADSRANGALLAAAVRRLRPSADPDEVEARAFLVMSLGESAMRLAISVDSQEGRKLVEMYKQMAVDALMCA